MFLEQIFHNGIYEKQNYSMLRMIVLEEGAVIGHRHGFQIPFQYVQSEADDWDRFP